MNSGYVAAIKTQRIENPECIEWNAIGESEGEISLQEIPLSMIPIDTIFQWEE
jgi:hypothetical protein